MMDQLKMPNEVGDGNDNVFSQDFDKLDLDFDGSGLDMEEILGVEAKDGGFDLDGDLNKLMAQDGSGPLPLLEQSDSSLQKLVSNMPGILEDTPQTNEQLGGLHMMQQQQQKVNMRAMNNQMNQHMNMQQAINQQLDTSMGSQMSTQMANQMNNMNLGGQQMNNQMNNMIGAQIQVNNQRMDNSMNSQISGMTQQTDPLLGNLKNSGSMQRQQQQHRNNQQSSGVPDALQLMVDQAMQGGPSAGGVMPAMSENEMRTVDLEQEKMKLLSRLQEINKRQQGDMNQAQSMNDMSMLMAQQRQQQQQQHQQQQNSMFMQQKNNMMGGMPQSNNFYQQQQPKKQPLTTSTTSVGGGVASVGGVSGGKGETPLSAFLRGSRKSQQPPPVAKPAPPQSALNKNIAGAPKAASIFAQMGQMSSELDAIQAQSNMMNNKGLGNPQFRTAMDASSASQEMVRKIQMMRGQAGGMGRNPGSRGNASFGADGSRKTTNYRTSGILPKHASETHLMRKAGLAKSKSKPGSLSRENQLYSLMKRTSSKNSMSRDDSLSQLFPIKRRPSSASKHKLGYSRSQGNIVMDGSSGSRHSGGGANARW